MHAPMPMTTNTGQAGFPWRRFGSDYLYACVLNLICAVLVTVLLTSGRHFPTNLAASMCIGSLVFVIVDGARLAIWGAGKRPAWLPFLGLLIVGAVAGQLGGSALFGWLTGNDISLASLNTARMPALMLFTLMASAGAALFFYSKSKIQLLQVAAARDKAQAEEVSRQTLQAQLQLLQAQIEPHMLFNTLANVQGLIALDPPRAQAMLDQLIAYLRATLSSSRADTTTLAQEFALMEAYLGLMAVRMGQRLHYRLSLPDTLRQARIAPMLLQPLVENAIRHGLEPAIAGGHIDIRAEQDGQWLLLTVADDGIGLGLGLRGPLHAEPGTQLGLSNITERLNALHGERAALSLDKAEPSGAIARLRLPLEGQ